MAATTPGRIKLPKGPKEVFELAAKIHQKHQADGATSELKNLQETDWDKVGPTIVIGQGYHTEAERLKGLMEEQYRLRDAVLKPITVANSDSASYLKGKYKKTPKRLTGWGFEVDDTPPAKSAAAKAKKAGK